MDWKIDPIGVGGWILWNIELYSRLNIFNTQNVWRRDHVVNDVVIQKLGTVMVILDDSLL